MKLILDITPMAINATAMFHIVRDTTQFLLGKYPDVQLVTVAGMVDAREFIANDYQLPLKHKIEVGEIFQKKLGVLIADNNRIASSFEKNIVSNGSLTIVFDPLYLCFLQPTQRAIVFVLDTTPITRPVWHNLAITKLYKEAFKLLWEPAVDIVSISESTARDLWANYGLDKNQVYTIPLYNRFEEIQNHADIDGSYKDLLFVGSLEERKNIRGLIEAYRLSRLYSSGIKLKIVGGDGHGADAIRALGESTAGVELLGKVSDQQLEDEYSTCVGLVYPSYWEGFGLPALEAVSRGIPCMVSSTGALREATGGLAVSVDPCDVDSIAAGLVELVTNAVKIRNDLKGSEKRVQLLEKYSRTNYLNSITTVIEKSYAEHFSSKEQVIDQSSDSGACMKHNAQGNDESAKETRSRIRSLIHSGRLHFTSDFQVPKNSYSIDYLYGVQVQKESELSRSVSKLRSSAPYAWPLLFALVLYRFFALRFANAYVRSGINKILLIQNMAKSKPEAK